MMIVPLAAGLEECKPVEEKESIPCQVTSTWNYTAPCSGHKAIVYNGSGNNIINFTFGSFGDSGLCNFTWNISTTGSYTYKIDTGDSGNIIVEVENLILSIIIGVGIIAAILVALAYYLDDQHFVLKVWFIISALTMLTIIPATYITGDTSILFHKGYLWFYRVFWIYIGVYIAYYVLRWAGLIVSNSDQDE